MKKKSVLPVILYILFLARIFINLYIITTSPAINERNGMMIFVISFYKYEYKQEEEARMKVCHMTYLMIIYSVIIKIFSFFFFIM